jgi:outer membrane receptor protein involved in Fe transport
MKMVKIVSVILSVVLTTFGSAAVTEAIFIGSFDLAAQASDNFDTDPDNPDKKVNRKVKKSLDKQSKIPVEKKKKTQTFPVKGLLLEKGTRRALTGITLYIRKIGSRKIVETLTTDVDGRFQCRLTSGKYTIIIAAVGYDKLEEDIKVGANSDKYLILRIVSVTTDPYQIIVRSQKKSAEVSKQQLNTEEAIQIPGASRDALSSIKSLPGISSSSVFNGYGNGIVIRGSSQEDSSFLVNNHAIGNFSKTGGLYHFGGFESIIEPELIESIDYIAGGFSAEYGNALGGVIDLNVKDPRTDRFGGFANLSMLSTSLMLEGPIGEKDSIAVSFKRGFLDQYIKWAESFNEEDDSGSEFIEYPNYYDGTAIYRHLFSKDNDFKLTAVGKSDSVEAEDDTDYVSERSSNRALLEDKYISLMGEWDFKNDGFRSILSHMITYSYSNEFYGDRAYHRQSFDTYELKQKIEYGLNQTHQLKAGVSLRINQAKVDSYSSTTPKEGEVYDKDYDIEIRLKKDFTFYYPSLFLMNQFEIGRFSLTPGIHGLYDSHNEHALVDPRFSLIYRLTEDTSLKGATGLYSQIPQYDECVEPWGTEGLKPEKSIHGILGVNHRLNENITLDIQTYYKSFYDLAVRIDDADPTRFGNDGSGYAYGTEILLRHQMTDHFFGWVSYTYSVAIRKDGPDKDERYFDSDMPHNFIAVASYKPNRYWSFGLKYQYASGLPYTDLLHTETVYDVDKDTYYPFYNGPINEDRLDAHQQLDFRIDKYWIFNNFILSTYLDVRNVLQTKNIFTKVYNKDYTQSEEFLNISSQIPMIFLGLKFDF